ncbi:helix-turn-helix domain-containing protein [Streptomyces griseofuscus]|uniref:helix-turn-helix domain-containing protein n=1 Tax=Streptomyces griseofuscus TaxID=146922 RepID=UPI0036842016
MSHRNAPLTPTGRLRLARCVVDDGWPLRRAAERFQVSHTTAARWANRYRQLGEAGMHDRSSRPRHSPRQTPTAVEQQVVRLRRQHRIGPVRLAARAGVAASTAHRTLLDEWAYIRPYTSDRERQEAFPDWLDWYNYHRPHTGISGQPPASRVTNLSGQHT